MNKSYKIFDQIFFASEEAQNEFLKHYPLTKNKVFYHNVKVNLPLFDSIFIENPSWSGEIWLKKNFK